MRPFHFYPQEEINALLSLRKGETKLGECIRLFEKEEESLEAFSGRFVLLGLPESIGIRANFGIPGAETAWPAFLKSFLNIQETALLSGKDFLLLGNIDFELMEEESLGADVETLRSLTARIDDMVFPVIEKIVAAGKVPLVIGGGHNNAFPLLKGSALALQQAVNAINLDAHSDFRQTEGRHSGNGFRYAYEEQFLEKYALLALHEGYNSGGIIEALNASPDLLPISWEDIFLRKRESWESALRRGLAHVSQKPFGLELDLDCLEDTLSSAATPVGLSPLQAMEYCYQGGQQPNSVYLHLPEGIAERADGLKNPFVGKLLAYLVQAFCKGVLERPASQP
jgi:formiminoglutamase